MLLKVWIRMARIVALTNRPFFYIDPEAEADPDAMFADLKKKKKKSKLVEVRKTWDICSNQYTLNSLSLSLSLYWQQLNLGWRSHRRNCGPWRHRRRLGLWYFEEEEKEEEEHGWIRSRTCRRWRRWQQRVERGIIKSIKPRSVAQEWSGLHLRRGMSQPSIAMHTHD